MRALLVLGLVVFILAIATNVHAGIYYNPSSYGQYSNPTVISYVVPVQPSYYQPVKHTQTYSYPLTQPYYIPYPVYTAPSAGNVYVTPPAQTIAVSYGVSYPKEKKKVVKKGGHKHHHHDDDDFDFEVDFDFDFPDFHDPDSDDFDDAWDDFKDWFD